MGGFFFVGLFYQLIEIDIDIFENLSRGLGISYVYFTMSNKVVILMWIFMLLVREWRWGFLVEGGGREESRS